MEGSHQMVTFKVDRLERIALSHLQQMVDFEKQLSLSGPDEEVVERTHELHSQLEEALLSLEKEAIPYEDLKLRLKTIRKQVDALNTRMERLTNRPKKNHWLLEEEEEKRIGEYSNPYEEEARIHANKNAKMRQVAEEVREKSLATQQLEKDMRDLEQIYTDLHRIVNEQSEVMDSIEESVSSATIDVQRGQRELKRAVKYKGAKTTATAALVGGVVAGGPIGIAAGSVIVGAIAAVGGMVTGIYGGRWLKRHNEKDDQVEEQQ